MLDNEHNFAGGKEETNILHKSKWCSDGMKKRSWWWLLEGIWLLSWLWPSNIYSPRILGNESRLLTFALLISQTLFE